jgi:FdhE protein
VAETFLRRWFGAKPTAPAAEEARAEIDRLLPDRPTTRGPLLWLRDILDDLVPDPTYLTVQLRTPEAVRDKLHVGQPSLSNEGLVVDARGFARRWQRVWDALSEHQPGMAAAAARHGPLDPSAIATTLVNNPAEAAPNAARQVGVEPVMVASILRLVLFPGFAAVEVTTAPFRQGIAWDRGFCPTCGLPPLLAEFRGLDQSRFLRCGLCAASWEVPRHWCPNCGTRDHEGLGFLAKEGEENRYRVATCDACRTGIKTLSTLSTLPPLMLLVADAATLHLDLAADERRYCPPLALVGRHGQNHRHR